MAFETQAAFAGIGHDGAVGHGDVAQDAQQVRVVGRHGLPWGSWQVWQPIALKAVFVLVLPAMRAMNPVEVWQPDTDRAGAEPEGIRVV